jgi:hypothetical protein
MKKRLNTEGITNELAGASLYFVRQNRTAQNPVADPSLSEQPLRQQEQEKQAKPATLQTRKPVKQSPAAFDKVEKYTTHLEPSLIKKIKLEAIEKDMKDYDVVRAALKQYFENNQ